MSEVDLSREGTTLVVSLNRPEVRNAVDGPTARALAEAFRDFDADPELSVAVLTGTGGFFCAGAHLATIAGGGGRGLQIVGEGAGPLRGRRITPRNPLTPPPG